MILIKATLLIIVFLFFSVVSYLISHCNIMWSIHDFKIIQKSVDKNKIYVII